MKKKENNISEERRHLNKLIDSLSEEQVSIILQFLIQQLKLFTK